MANGDYGYFGKGDTGYAQYMTAFNRNFGVLFLVTYVPFLTVGVANLVMG